MRAYSLDLRERIIGSWQEGTKKAAIARLYKVNLSTVKRYVARYQALGHVEATVPRRMAGKLTKRLRKQRQRQVKQKPDYTLAQHVGVWNTGHVVKVSESCLSRAFRQLGITRKKKTVGAVERDEAARAKFREMLKALDAERVVVVDESGSRIGMVPLYGRSERGQRLYDRVIRNYGQTVTVLARMSLSGMQAAMTINGAVDRRVFETFVEPVLCPSLRPGQVVIMDNLSSHKSARVERLLEQAGCRALFLPAYSPDLSPIEEAFSKLKAFVRRCRCQTVPDLLDALERGLTRITAKDAHGWFAHAGFCL